MHVTIRRYARAARVSGGTSNGTTEDMVQAGRRLAAILGRLPGFVSFVILETDGGGLVTVCTLEGRPGLEQAGRLTGDFFAQHGLRHCAEGEALTGRIVYQRGL
jgi:hypothetical protein